MVLGVNGLTWVIVLKIVVVDLKGSLDHVIGLGQVVEVVLVLAHGHKS